MTKSIKTTMDLDQDDLISLCKGTSPNYSVFENPLVKKAGSYRGGFNDHWSWDVDALKKMDINELFDLYHICKTIWS